jgi:hypothetical protein
VYRGLSRIARMGVLPQVRVVARVALAIVGGRAGDAVVRQPSVQSAISGSAVADADA